jgi:LPS sulfotransferase NodH
MNKFFIMTRGRTGSTAIIDELSEIGSVRAAQELFIKRDFQEDLNTLNRLNYWEQYLAKNQFMMPFELWKLRANWWQKQYRNFVGNEGLEDYFLNELESRAQRDNKRAFGFKVLSNHFDENPMLKDVLLARGYRVLYLKRNVPHQVISGMIANQRGVYNTKKEFRDDKRYTIDVDEFKKLVEWEAQSIVRDIELLKSSGFNFIEVTYEEFMADREAFFGRVLAFLGVPPETPQSSSYSVMIKDLKHTVENYQTVADCASAIGMRIE